MLPVSIVTHDAGLRPLQLRVLFRRLGFDEIPTNETILAPGNCMKVWCYLLIHRVKVLDQEQRDFLFDNMMPVLARFSEMAYRDYKGEPVPLLVLADGRYASWTLHSGWLDLVAGENLTQPRHPPMETLGYNLAVMFQRNMRACEELQRRANAQSNVTDSV